MFLPKILEENSSAVRANWNSLCYYSSSPLWIIAVLSAYMRKFIVKHLFNCITGDNLIFHVLQMPSMHESNKAGDRQDVLTNLFFTRIGQLRTKYISLISSFFLLRVSYLFRITSLFLIRHFLPVFIIPPQKHLYNKLFCRYYFYHDSLLLLSLD